MVTYDHDPSQSTTVKPDGLTWSLRSAMTKPWSSSTRSNSHTLTHKHLHNNVHKHARRMYGLSGLVTGITASEIDAKKWLHRHGHQGHGHSRVFGGRQAVEVFDYALDARTVDARRDARVSKGLLGRLLGRFVGKETGDQMAPVLRPKHGRAWRADGE